MSLYGLFKVADLQSAFFACRKHGIEMEREVRKEVFSGGFRGKDCENEEEGFARTFSKLGQREDQ